MYLYFLFLYIASLFNPKAKRLVKGQRATWQVLKERIEAGEKYIWFHAASVGEFEQARPIIEKLKLQQPGKKVLLTFFSPSGYEMRKDYPHADVVAYLPLATKRNAKRFLKLVNPEMAIFVKYEFWPAYLKALKKSDIPTYIIAAIFRENQAFFKWFGGSYRKLLNCFTTLFVQDDDSKILLCHYGLENVVVAGDTRFDRVTSIARNVREIPQIMRFTEPEITPLTIVQPEVPKVIVAGSTWPEDEAMLARYVEEHPSVKLILVPHEIDETHLHTIFNLFKGRYVRFTEANLLNVTSNQTLLIDTMGMLSTIYRFGQVAYVGGGFGEGIHNTIEPAVYGIPVVFGPNHEKFREAHGLKECGGGFAINNYEELATVLDNALAHHEALGRLAKEYVKSELGATERIYNALWHK